MNTSDMLNADWWIKRAFRNFVVILQFVSSGVVRNLRKRLRERVIGVSQRECTIRDSTGYAAYDSVSCPQQSVNETLAR